MGTRELPRRAGDAHDSAEDELTELADELRQKARPGERLIDTHRRLAEEGTERRRRAYLLDQIVEALPINIFAKDGEHRYVIANKNVSNLVGREPSEVLGKTDFDILPESAARTIRESDEKLRASGGLRMEELAIARPSGEPAYVFVGKIVARFEESGEQVLVGFSIDITDRKRIEDELRSKIALIEHQRATIQRLSTPIIEVWDGVLTTPLLGELDSPRAGALLEGVLAAVVRRGARFVIVDITGVEAIDAVTAAHLLELIRGVRLLGAEGILTGVSPSVARTMVAQGVDLGRITTLANLRGGLRYCMRRMRALGDVR